MDYKLQGQVTLDDTGFNTAIDSMKKKSEGLGGILNNSMGKAVLGANLATQAINLVVAGVKSAVSEYMILDKNIAKVNTLLDKQVLSSVGLRNEILKISGETGIWASELAEASYQALSAGVETEKLTDFISKMTVLSKGGFTDMTTAVDVATTVMNAYGKEVYSVEEITDKLIQIQNKGKVTVGQLGSTFYNVIPYAAAYKIGLDEIGGAMALMTAKGTPAAQVTTQLKALIIELSRDTAGAGKQFKLLTGKSFPEFIEKGGNMAQVIKILDEGAKNANQPLAKLFTSSEAGSAALTLATDSAKGFSEQVKNIANSVGEAEKANKTATDNIADTWAKLKIQIMNDFGGEGELWDSLNKGLLAFARNTYTFAKNTVKLLTFPYQLGKHLDEVRAEKNGTKPENEIETPKIEKPKTEEINVKDAITGEINLNEQKPEVKKEKTAEQLEREKLKFEREQLRAERAEFLREDREYHETKAIEEETFNQEKLTRDIEFFNKVSEMRNSFLYDKSDIERMQIEYEYEQFLKEQEFRAEQLEADLEFYKNKKEYAEEYAETLTAIKELEVQKLRESIMKEEALRQHDLSFTERIKNSKENLIKGGYRTLLNTNKNVLKALSEFFVKSIATMAQEHGAELLYSGIKTMWKGKLDIAEGMARNAKLPGSGVALMAAGANEVREGSASIAQSALFGALSVGLGSIGGSGDEGGSSGGDSGSYDVPSSAEDIKETEKTVDSLEKEKTVTVYTDGDVNEILLSMLNTFNGLAKDYDNIEIIRK